VGVLCLEIPVSILDRLLVSLSEVFRNFTHFLVENTRTVHWSRSWSSSKSNPTHHLRLCSYLNQTSSQEIRHPLWIPRVITMFTSAHYWALSWARWNQTTPSHPVYLRTILISTSHLRLGLSSDIFSAFTANKIGMYFSHYLLAFLNNYHNYNRILDIFGHMV
jgi:hypothetical protein